MISNAERNYIDDEYIDEILLACKEQSDSADVFGYCCWMMYEDLVVNCGYPIEVYLSALKVIHKVLLADYTSSRMTFLSDSPISLQEENNGC